MRVSILDLQRASWLPMLGLGPEVVALDIGCGYGALTHSLARSVKEVYSTESIPERIEFTQMRLKEEGINNVHLIQAPATTLPFVDNTFDLIAANGILRWLGEWDLESDPRAAQLKFLSSVWQILKNDGVIVIGVKNRFAHEFLRGGLDSSGIPYTSLLPRRLATIWLRLHVRRNYRTYTYSARGFDRLFREAGFASVSLYWADPTYIRPYNLFPLEARREIREHFLNKLTHPGLSVRGNWTHRLKWIAAKSGILPWIVSDFVVIAFKNPCRQSEVHDWFREQIQSRLASEASRAVEPRKIVFVSRTRAFDYKHTLHFWRPPKARARLFGKAEVCGRDRPSRLQRELANLRLVSERLQQHPGLAVRVPEPIDFWRSGNIAYCLESAAGGTQFCRLVRKPKYFNDGERTRADFSRIVQAGVALTKALQELSAVVEVLRPELYKVPEGLSREQARRIDRMRYFSPYSEGPAESWVQHGDFTVENVFIGLHSGQVDVIDWAHLSAGFPPAYDFFSLIVSTAYLDQQGQMSRFATDEEFWTASFRDLFFSNEKFGRIVGELLLEVCGAFDIPFDSIPALLLEFLIIRTNLFRLDQDEEQEKIHRAMLIDFLAQQKRPVFGKFAPLTDARVQLAAEHRGLL